MTEGLTIALNGATLLSVLGIAAKVYMASKPQRLEQPITVREEDQVTPTRQCDERHIHLEKQNENMFARMSSAEQRVSALEATSLATKDQLSRMEKKLDALLQRK
jgi:uncharacterized protein HemX